jgi:hypothetical protein
MSHKKNTVSIEAQNGSLLVFSLTLKARHLDRSPKGVAERPLYFILVFASAVASATAAAVVVAVAVAVEVAVAVVVALASRYAKASALALSPGPTKRGFSPWGMPSSSPA